MLAQTYGLVGGINAPKKVKVCASDGNTYASLAARVRVTLFVRAHTGTHSSSKATTICDRMLSCSK
jgi:hypothetical protein